MNKTLNGFLLIDKQPGWTSFDVCAKLRKVLGVKRIGHTGTLDPFATGLLVVAVGKCTKLIPLLEKDIKTYRTKILLGRTSETLDPESEITEAFNGHEPSLVEIEALLVSQFTGAVDQIPPQYSALKINGKRAYDLAREGKAVEMKPRHTEVKSINVLNYHFPALEVELSVAAGFYVRSFARDVGTKLCGGGLCSELRRIGVGALSLESDDWPIVRELNKVTASDLIKPHHLIKNIVHIKILFERIADLQAGRAIFMDGLPENGKPVFLVHEDKTVALAEVKAGNLQPRTVF